MLLVLDAENRVLAASRAARQGLDGIEEGPPVPDELLGGEVGTSPSGCPTRSRAERGAPLPQPARRARRLRGAQGRLHGGRLARAPDAAGAPARPAGDGVASGAGHRGARRAGAGGGRAHPRADRRHPVPERAGDGTGGRRARLDAGPSGRRGGARSDSGDCGPRRRRRPGARRSLRLSCRPTAHAAGRRREPRPELDPLRGPGSTLTVTVSPGRLTVADDGAGVSEEDLPRLFERFFRADRVRGSRGTGLGLAVVKHIVAAGGGTVEAEGAPGHGLTITCAFPAR